MRGYHSDMLNVSNHEELIQLVIDPLVHQSTDSIIKIKTSIQMALTLECIWNFRNQVVRQAKQVNQHSIHLAIKRLESRIVEQIQALESEEKEKNYKIMNWTTPNSGMIKLNTNATLFNNSAALVMVARDDRGCVLKVWSKVEPISYPLIAKVAAMYWVL